MANYAGVAVIDNMIFKTVFYVAMAVEAWSGLFDNLVIAGIVFMATDTGFHPLGFVKIITDEEIFIFFGYMRAA